MRTITLAGIALSATTSLAACTGQASGPPVATRPSLTIYPVHMAGEDRRDVAAVVAVMLERGGMTEIEIADAAFTTDPATAFETQAAEFAAFAAGQHLETEYALYGAILGSPQRGVDEIRGVLVDRDGHVAWSDRQTRSDAAMRHARPNDPMSSTVFLVDRLRGPLDLLDTPPADAAEGRWARAARAESLVPGEAELAAIERRQASLRDAASGATVVVYPAWFGDGWSTEAAELLARRLNSGGTFAASVAGEPLPVRFERGRNEMRMLWAGARSIQDLVRANPPGVDYVLVADFVMPGAGSSGGGGGEAVAVHTYLLESDGDWVIVDHQNDRHRDFEAVHPDSVRGCCDVVARRIDGVMRGS